MLPRNAVTRSSQGRAATAAAASLHAVARRGSTAAVLKHAQQGALAAAAEQLRMVRGSAPPEKAAVAWCSEEDTR